MTGGVKFEVTGKESVNDFKRKLGAARESLKDSSGVMRRVSVFLDQWVQRNFQNDGQPAGGWAPYKYGGRLTVKSKATAQSIDGRKYIDGSAKLLRNTGRLRLSFLPGVKEGVALIGSELPYSKPHEEGSSTLPQRRMLPREDDAKAPVTEIFWDWIRVQLKEVSK